MPVIATIRKLSCAYNRKDADKVLYIDELDIQQAELIFLLGASGAGKSTLLEILGLMNNTIASGDVVLSVGGKDYSYQKLWQEGNLEISSIRKKHFSFIFQNTNLMENFTAYENICLPRMIQEEVAQEAVMGEAKQLMNRVGLSEKQVSSGTLAVNLSGGQKQRLSFVRALTSNCSVLFCDEPTGNLDERNANELMTVIKEEIDIKKITVIVVSHDIDLALNHASRIICVTKDERDNYGTIHKENIFDRKVWENISHQQKHDLRQKIKALYISNTDRNISAIPEEDNQTASFRSKFHWLFFHKEGLMLAGKNHVNLFVLIFLFFFTFLSIGFANGTISYLDTKLSNAFVNWLNISVPMVKGSEIETIKKELSSQEMKSKYMYKHVSTYYENRLDFLNRSTNKFIPVQTRSVDMKDGGDPIVTDITDDKHRVQGNTSFISSEDFSVIVTEGLLKEMNYDTKTPFIYLKYTGETDSNGLSIDTIPVGVRSVVKEIPGKVQCAYTSYFWDAYQQSYKSAFEKKYKNTILFYCPGNREVANNLRANIQSWIDAHDYIAIDPQASPPDTCKDTWVPGYKVVVDFHPVPVYDSIETFYNELRSDKKLNDYIIKNNIIRIYNYYDFTPRFESSNTPDRLSINFDKLDKVREFADYVKDNYNNADDKKIGAVMEADVSAIKDKENFKFLSDVTYVTSAIIILLSTIAVCLFIFNMLRMHLAKVKMNIGTFTATGLSNATAQMIYFEIILTFILFSLAVSIIGAWGAGYFIDKAIASQLVLEKGMSYFKINGLLTYLNIGLILTFSLLISYLTIRRMLSKTPGDLIYNR